MSKSATDDNFLDQMTSISGRNKVGVVEHQPVIHEFFIL